MKNMKIKAARNLNGGAKSYQPENRGKESVHAMNPNMTVIMSANRLNAVRRCDKIFVLENGYVVQEGTMNN